MYVDTVGLSKDDYKETVGLGSDDFYDNDIGHGCGSGDPMAEEVLFTEVKMDDAELKGDLKSSTSSTTSMRERAVEGIRRRKKQNMSRKKKLKGMANHLHQVLLTSIMAVGCFASERVVAPACNLVGKMGMDGDFWQGRPAVLEVFAGCARYPRLLENGNTV